MKVHVLLFARARDLAGSGEVEADLAEGAAVGALRTELERTKPALRPLLATLHVAINSEYATDADIIPPGAEIACFPPVSGG